MKVLEWICWAIVGCVSITMIGAIAIVIMIAYAVGNSAMGADLEIGIGATRFTPHGDGVWYQKDYGPYELNVRKQPSGSIGMIFRPASNLRLRAGAMYLGRYDTICECTSSDYFYEQFQRGNVKKEQWPATTFRTKGDAFGPYITAGPEFRVGGQWTVFGEAGVAYIGSSNKVHVTNWRPAIGDFTTSLTPGAPVDGSVDNGRRWSVTPIVGIGVQKDNVSLAVQRIQMKTIKGEWYPIVTGPAWRVEMRIAF